MSGHPERAGGLFRRPAPGWNRGSGGFLPLRRWPKGRLVAELARVDARLAYLATAGPAGPETKSLRKYRMRLARAR